MKFEFEITTISVLLTDALDHISLHTTLPGPFPLDVDKSNLCINFQTPYDTGIEYVKKFFGKNPDQIYNARHS